MEEQIKEARRSIISSIYSGKYSNRSCKWCSRYTSLGDLMEQYRSIYNEVDCIGKLILEIFEQGEPISSVMSLVPSRLKELEKFRSSVALYKQEDDRVKSMFKRDLEHEFFLDDLTLEQKKRLFDVACSNSCDVLHDAILIVERYADLVDLIRIM